MADMSDWRAKGDSDLTPEDFLEMERRATPGIVRGALPACAVVITPIPSIANNRLMRVAAPVQPTQPDLQSV